MFVVVVVLACLLVAVAFVVLLVGLARSNVFLLLEMETVVPGFEGGDFDVTLSFLVLLLSFLLRAVSVGLVLEGELVELGLSGLVWFLVLEKMLLLGNFVVLVWFLEETRLDGLGVGFVGLGGGFLFQRLLLLFFFGIQHCSTMLRFQPGGTEANRDRKEQKNIEQ